MTTGPRISVEDCYFRMLSPREGANAQRFPGNYIFHGTKGEQQLQNVQLKPGTQGCVVLSGTLTDPYSGATIRYEKGVRQQLVEIDHTIPLAAAWDLGAHQWSQQKRTDLANDPRNLQTRQGEDPGTAASSNPGGGRVTPTRRRAALRIRER